MSDGPRRRGGFLTRFGLALATAGIGAFLFTRWAPRDVDVVVELPRDEAVLPAAFDLRVVAASGAELGRARRERLPEARSFLVKLRLPRGTHRMELWDARPPAGGQAPARWEAEFAYGGEETVTAGAVRTR